MDYENMRVGDLKTLAKERGLRRLNKAELIDFIRNNLQPRTRPPPISAPAPRTRPPRPTRPPPPPPSVRFRPDRPRQLEERDPQPVRPTTFKPYQLKPKRGKETFIEPPVEQPPSNQKQIKCMKKKLGKLNKKIRHSRKKHNNLRSKRNALKKKIEELKRPRKPEELHEPEETFHPIEFEQAFNRAYKSFRINGRLRMDVDTFFDRIRQNLIDLMSRTLIDLGSGRVQMTAWIKFIQALKDDAGNVIGADRV